MLRTKSQTRERTRTDFAVVGETLIHLKMLQRLRGIIIPVTVGLAFEIAAILQRLLDFLIAIGIGALLIERLGGSRAAGTANPAATHHTA